MQIGTVGTVRVVAVLVLVAFVVVQVGAASAHDDKGGNGPPSGPMGKPSEQTTKGHILVPTEPVARTFSPMLGHGVTLFAVPATPYAGFALTALDSNSVTLCALNVCRKTADFDVVFFKQEESGAARAVAVHDGLGDEGGVVPAEASFGIAYLRTPGLVPTAKGHAFLYTEFI